MSTIPISATQVSVEDYLDGEIRSAVKHDYLGGIVYAMAGGSEPHNIIASNLGGILYAQLRNCATNDGDRSART